MTSYKLSLGQVSAIKTSSMELNFKRSRAQDFSSSVEVSEGRILMPNLCDALGMADQTCDTLVLTTQVKEKQLQKYFYNFNKPSFSIRLDVCNANRYSWSKQCCIHAWI